MTGYMTLQAQTSTLYIELRGPNAKAWPLTGGAACYDGDIAGLPADALAELLERGLITRTDSNDE